MSEELHFYPEEEPQALHVSARQYYAEAARRIIAGETVWVRRDVDNPSDSDVWDYYLQKRYGGRIERHRDTQRCEAYLAPSNPKTRHSWTLAHDVSLEQAVQFLEEAASHRHPR